MNDMHIVEQIFHAGVESVLPDKMIRKTLKIENEVLHISDIQIPLASLNHIYVIGAGKASALMAKEVEDILGSRITDGHIIVKHGHTYPLKYIKVTEAGHPTPDSYGFQATQKILELMEKADEKDLVLCLLSGGGSSLLADYPEGASPEDLIKLNQLLLNSGANIHEINTVRKHLSKVKGGQLAQAAAPALLVSLILSDVIGDSLDVIASGPTSPDSSTFQDAENILKKFQLIQEIPLSLREYIQNGVKGIVPETPKNGDPIFRKVHNLIIGSNTIALESAKKKASELRINSLIITSELDGEAYLAAESIVKIALKKQNELKKGERICLLFGGETTVQVTGNGLGGRNQHLALCAAQLLSDKKGITLLSAGTDGNDGPTDAAGAMVTINTKENALKNKVDINQYIKDFNSYHFFKEAGGHIITGSTLTNVMDLIIVLVE